LPSLLSLVAPGLLEGALKFLGFPAELRLLVAACVALISDGLHSLLCVFQKFSLSVDSVPVAIKGLNFIVIQVVVMICQFLFAVASPFLHYLASLVIQHSFLGDSSDAVAVFVTLVFLGDGLAAVVLAGAVFEVGLLFHLSVFAHGRGRDIALTDIGASLVGVVETFVGIGELHHLFEGVSSSSEEVILESEAAHAEGAHNLMHLSKGIVPSSEGVQLVISS
jgi:hypothetical protein